MVDADTIPGSLKRGTREAACDRAVDAWVRRELSRQYRAVLDEPVPGDLVRLAALVAERRARG